MVLLDFISGTYHLTPYAGQFLSHSLASIGRVISGFILASFFGLLLGIATGSFSIFNRLLDPLINFLRSIPGIGWLPLAIVWFGIGNQTTIFLIALAAFFPVYINTAQGVRTVSQEIINAAKMLGATKYKLFVGVIIPAALPSVFSGVRLGLGISWAYLVLGELTGVNKGLGAVMMDARMLGNTDIIIVCMVVIAFWGKVSDLLLIKAINRFQPLMGAKHHD